jgi:hypothetical protein
MLNGDSPPQNVVTPTTAEGWDQLGEQMAAAVAQRRPAFAIEDLPAFLIGVGEAA